MLLVCFIVLLHFLLAVKLGHNRICFTAGLQGKEASQRWDRLGHWES